MHYTKAPLAPLNWLLSHIAHTVHHTDAPLTSLTWLPSHNAHTVRTDRCTTGITQHWHLCQTAHTVQHTIAHGHQQRASHTSRRFVQAALCAQPIVQYNRCSRAPLISKPEDGSFRRPQLQTHTCMQHTQMPIASTDHNTRRETRSGDHSCTATCAALNRCSRASRQRI